MVQQRGSSSKTGGLQGEMPLGDRHKEGGRHGGQHMPQPGGQTDKSRRKGGQDPQADLEREKSEKGKGSPA